MKTIMALILGLALCGIGQAQDKSASVPTLKDMVEHFKKSGMNLDNVQYLRIEPERAAMGIVEQVNITDDHKKRKNILKTQYNFAIMRMKDEATVKGWTRQFKDSAYANGLFVLSFGEDANKDKITKIFSSYGAAGH